MSDSPDSGFSLFKWGMGLMGAVLSTATIGGGRKIIGLDREVGELKTGKIATDDAITQLRESAKAINGRFDHIDEKLDRVIERLGSGK